MKGIAPEARVYHSAVPIEGQNRIIFFGGNGEEKSFNDIHVLSVFDSGTSRESLCWSSPIAEGSIPDPRCGHVMSVLKTEKQVLIFGGWDTQKEDDQPPFVFSDSFVLDTENWKWNRPAENAAASLPECTGSGFVSSQNEIIVFGGQGKGPAYERNADLHILSKAMYEENFNNMQQKKRQAVSKDSIQSPKRKCG